MKHAAPVALTVTHWWTDEWKSTVTVDGGVRLASAEI